MGNLASAMLDGVLKSGLIENDRIIIYDLFSAKTEVYAAKGIAVADSAEDAAGDAEFVVCAVKPNDIGALLTKISGTVKKTGGVIISPAAGTPLEKLVGFLWPEAPVVRIMPNVNAAAGCSMTALCTTETVTEEQKKFALSYCDSFGATVELEEKLFSAYAAVAGCAPAFVYRFIDALSFAGVKNGLPAALARKVAAQTVLGSAKLVEVSGEHPMALRDKVCSPGGTTVEGVAALNELGFDNAVITAVDRAVEKDRQMKNGK